MLPLPIGILVAYKAELEKVAEAPWFLMAPRNNAHGKPSLSAALSHTFAARSEEIDVKGKTVAGIVFALLCFAAITCVFLTRRWQDILNGRLTSLHERLIRRVPCLRRTQPEVAQETDENTQPISRQDTFPPPSSRSSTFDQRLPPYAIQDPHAQNSCLSTIRDDGSGEQSRAVTPS